MTGLLVFINWKGKTYNTILVIINRLTKIIYHESVKASIDALELAEITLDMVVYYHNLLNSIVGDCGSVFISKTWLSICYFLEIKQTLSTISHPQIDGQTE